ncbi:MAG TPA: LPS export ABC transporter permease LptG [Leucothrix sp.]|nr:LPS export ABC transporter permease LptG [Leucothrix sp.]
MKILDRYLWTATLQGLLIAWIALVILDSFFAFISESGKTNALYTTSQALIYLVYTLPARFYEFFPTATLIGALLGLGNLSANSEFTAMRAAGVSVRQIVFSVLKLGLLLAIGIFFMGEYLVPASDLHARNFKAHLKNKNIVLVGGAGLWVKEKNNILHIGKVITSERLTDISIYTFKDDHTGLKSLTTSTDAIAANNGWSLKNVETVIFEERSVRKQRKEEVYKSGFLNPQILDVATVKPDQLSSGELSKIINHQKNNNLKSDKYELIFWKRYSVPLSALVMLILAMPFLFGSTRGGGAGQRVFIGIVVGIVFYLVNRSINELGIVYGFSAILSAFVPSLIFLGVGMFALTRIR